jgi:hypothetical protein
LEPISVTRRFSGPAREVADVLRPSLALNGITQIRRIAALAETYYVAVAPYHNGGPIGTAAALHLAASLPNFVIQQIPLPEAEADRRMRAEITGTSVEVVKDGFAALPVGAGLGITVRQKLWKIQGACLMRRRQFLTGLAGAGMAGALRPLSERFHILRLRHAARRTPWSRGLQVWVQKVKITNMKPFGVSLTPDSDRPYVFVKLGRMRASWGGGSDSGRQSRSCHRMREGLQEFVIGSDPCRSTPLAVHVRA